MHMSRNVDLAAAAVPGGGGVVLCPLFPPSFFHGSHLFFASSIELCQEIGDSLARLEAAATLPKIKSGGGSDDRRRREGIANDLFKHAHAIHV